MNTGGPAKLLADNLELLRSDGTVRIFWTDFPLDFYLDTVSNAPIQGHIIGNIKCPVLFLQGTADNVYRRADAKMAYELLASSNAQTKHIEIANSNHELDNAAEKAAEAALSWLESIGIWEK